MTQTLTAYRDFLHRYLGVFRSVWSIRAQLDPPPRSADELAFLPAHLELTETPVSPKPRWAMRIIVAMFGLALLWACVGKLDIVAVASGRIVPSGRTKVVQPLEASVVAAIHVRDGQRVKAGELLIELDSAATTADARKADDALAASAGNAARYQALLQALDRGAAPKPFEFSGSPADIATHNHLAQSEFAAYRARHEALGSQLAQREAELATVQALIPSLRQAEQLAKTRAEDLAALEKKHFVARHDSLTAQQQLIDAERNRTQQENRLLELQAAITTQGEERASLAAEFRRQWEDGLREARVQQEQLTQDADKTQRRNELMRLTAPVAGTVQQLAVHTVGGVVTPAQALLAIVPTDDVLEVEALVLNRDIGFVHAGQAAVIKVESFPYTRYGHIEGEVLSVSHDAQQHEQLGLVYQARVRLQRHSIDVDGARIRLSPGMNLSVEIKTGKRRVIDYLLSPLQQHGSEALRER